MKFWKKTKDSEAPDNEKETLNENPEKQDKTKDEDKEKDKISNKVNLLEDDSSNRKTSENKTVTSH